MARGVHALIPPIEVVEASYCNANPEDRREWEVGAQSQFVRRDFACDAVCHVIQCSYTRFACNILHPCMLISMISHLSGQPAQEYSSSHDC